MCFYLVYVRALFHVKPRRMHTFIVKAILIKNVSLRHVQPSKRHLVGTTNTFQQQGEKKNNLILQQVTHFVDLATEMYLSFSPEDGSVRAETCRSDSVSGVNKCVH